MLHAYSTVGDNFCFQNEIVLLLTTEVHKLVGALIMINCLLKNSCYAGELVATRNEQTQSVT